MKRIALIIMSIVFVVVTGLWAESGEAVFPGADENTPSRSQYFSWINNTNEGATEAHTLINMAFFQWLHDEYGMVLDIYAFDAGAIDGKRFYGKMDSDRFRGQFPNGFGPLVKKAAAFGARLGVWGGPDGFGDTPEEEEARIEQMVSLCRDFNFVLFKFDAVCGPLRPEKEDAFIRMMTQCRVHSPDLILLNHRLGLKRARAHATTFLWEGKETYIDVFSTNRITAPHHRADAISRGLPPGLKRLTEDHGVCISSCTDYWDDDLVLQAFNRGLILSPQVYGSPWLLPDRDYPKFARIYNLHRKYRHILVKGMALPESEYGPYAVSRGDAATRLITLRNLTWEPETYEVKLGNSIGLTAEGMVHVRRFHPGEHIYGTFRKGQVVRVEVPPFRSCLLLVTTMPCDEPGVVGCDYEVVRNVPGKPVLINLRGMPGSKVRFTLPPGKSPFKKALLAGKPADKLLRGKTLTVHFPGRKLTQPFHRKLAEASVIPVPGDADALYEATVFAADNNALEVRSLLRSKPTVIDQVRAARKALFEQAVFKERGIWDRNLFDGDMATGFWPSRKYNRDQRVAGGCFRLDLGAVTGLHRVVLHVPDEYSLQPLLNDEGNHVEVSADLITWERLTYLAGKRMEIDLSKSKPVRYLRFRYYPDRIVEIEGFKKGKKVSTDCWRASILFAHPARKKPVKAWHSRVVLDEFAPGSYLCIALEGEHGVEGAYAALKVDGKLTGCPHRAASFPSNTWEYINAKRDKNYTYYAPLTEDMVGKPIDVYVLAYDKKKTGITPVVWVTAYPAPFKGKLLQLE